jgi:hypothetical protein
MEIKIASQPFDSISNRMGIIINSFQLLVRLLQSLVCFHVAIADGGLEIL